MNKEYLKLKEENQYQIVLLKNGQFYNVFGEDAFILNYMTGYKLFYFYDKLCVSISKDNLQLILSRLRTKSISYVVIEKNSKEKYYGTINNYVTVFKESISVKRKEYLIDKIIKKSKLLKVEQLENILDKLEKE